MDFVAENHGFQPKLCQQSENRAFQPKNCGFWQKKTVFMDCGWSLGQKLQKPWFLARTVVFVDSRWNWSKTVVFSPKLQFLPQKVHFWGFWAKLTGQRLQFSAKTMLFAISDFESAHKL